MEIENFSKNIKKIEYQRNLFILLTIISLICILLLSVINIYKDEKIILVPGLKNISWVKEKTVSENYIEEMSIMFLNLLLDITPHNVSYKKSLILSHLPNKNQTDNSEIKKYFFDMEEKYKKFSISSHFAPKKIEINPEKLEAIATGILSNNFGKNGEEVSEETYKLNFIMERGGLKIKSFENVKDAKK